MTNAIAYPDLALEKFTGLDSSEDALTFNLTERKIGFCLGIRHATDATQQALYDQRRRDLFGSILRGPAQDWYDGLAVGKTWDEIKTEFLNRFTDDKDKYLKRIDAENLKRQADENIKSYIYRVVKVVDLGWSGSSENERKQKYIDFFLRGLAPPALKQNAYQRKIEHPAESWDDLKTHVINKDLSYSISTSMTGIQSGPSDSRISGLEEQVRLLTEQLKENKINATYDPNNPRDKQNFTRFCKYCKKSGHTIKFCFKKKNDEELVEKEKKKLTNLEMNIAKEVTLEKGKIANDREVPLTMVQETEKIRMIEHTRDKGIPNEMIHTIVETAIVVTDLVQIMRMAAENGPLTGIQPATVAQHQMSDSTDVEANLTKE